MKDRHLIVIIIGTQMKHIIHYRFNSKFTSDHFSKSQGCWYGYKSPLVIALVLFFHILFYFAVFFL
jgi:hypothetical protein